MKVNIHELIKEIYIQILKIKFKVKNYNEFIRNLKISNHINNNNKHPTKK